MPLMNSILGMTDEELDRTQLGLGAAGMAPGVGNVADLADAGISLGRGDLIGTIAGLAAAIPILGQVISGIKMGGKAGKVLKIGRDLDSDDIAEIAAHLPRHTLEELSAVASGTSPLKVYHGAPAKNIESILEGGIQLPEHGEKMARQVADKYGIPWSEWKNYVTHESPSFGYGPEVSRLSTATAPIASRWASHFPQGEVLSQANDAARKYIHARKLAGPAAIRPSDLVDKMLGVRGFRRRGETDKHFLDRIGAEDLMPQSDFGNILEFLVDPRALDQRTRRRIAQQVKSSVDKKYADLDLMGDWNFSYKDIKIHPSNLRNPRALTIDDLIESLSGRSAEDFLASPQAARLIGGIS